MLDGILNSVSPLEGTCDLINTIKSPFLDVISRLYGVS